MSWLEGSKPWWAQSRSSHLPAEGKAPRPARPSFLTAGKQIGEDVGGDATIPINSSAACPLAITSSLIIPQLQRPEGTSSQTVGEKS